MAILARLAWPRTLFARVLAILIAGLVLAHVLSFGVIMVERWMASKEMMLNYLESDVASSVALLDRIPAAERPLWLPRLARRYYHFSLEPGQGGPSPESGRAAPPSWPHRSRGS